MLAQMIGLPSEPGRDRRPNCIEPAVAIALQKFALDENRQLQPPHPGVTAVQSPQGAAKTRHHGRAQPSPDDRDAVHVASAGIERVLRKLSADIEAYDVPSQVSLYLAAEMVEQRCDGLEWDAGHLHKSVARNPAAERIALRTTGKVLQNSGQGGIRTHRTLAGTPAFATGRFNRSRTCPRLERDSNPRHRY